MKTTDAINHFGSITNLAKALRISRQAVHQWGENIPRISALRIEEITGGALTEQGPESSRSAADDAA